MYYEVVLTAKEAEDRGNWLKSRNMGIGGSDAAAIVGLSKWKSEYQLWLEKTGQVEAEDISDKEVVYWGTQLEEMVAREFCKITGKKVKKQGLFRSKKHPFMLASVDRMVVGERAGLECKTTNAYAAKEWDGDEIPPAYYVQCQHYMMVTGLDMWYIACLVGGNHFVWKEVPRCQDDIDELEKAECEFWRKVENGIMPALDGSDNTSEMLTKKYQGGKKEVLELESSAGDMVREIAELDASKKEIESRINALKNNLKEMLGDFEQGHTGDCIIHWRTIAGRKTIDKKRLLAELPDIHDKYLKQGNPTRAFSYEIKEDK